LVNVASHIDASREKLRIDAKMKKIEKDLRKLEVAFTKSKYDENARSIVDTKISTNNEEMKYLKEQLQFLNHIENAKQ
jgi:hypothetical protein